MAWLMFLCLVCSLISTQATRSTIPAVSCKDNQHCSDCDGKGNCLECTLGYFGRRCNASCSENCLNKKCTESGNGDVNCTDGCSTGHQGLSCNTPCYRQWGSCTACPGGCDGGYCQLGSSCVSGCIDSYYGSDCQSCSKLCKTCNRSTGGCIECHPPFEGQNCGCENCTGFGEDCKEGGCKNDLQGNGGQTRTVLAGLLVSLPLLVSGILVTICLLYYRRLAKQREQVEQREQMHQDEVAYLEYLPSVQGDITTTNRHSDHAYYDVEDGEIGPTIVFL
ncbi:cell death abnormality protein 1-like [Haliotis rubra]|uniref:cell death abnormality protein 1-like n=1 Tax=Haliotis rubra TaxID=36100 RepID=UPI001EE5EC29|nr:cell death abnormality protein 1-like [Haliotis rubra]